MYLKGLGEYHRLSRCQQLVVNLQVLDGHAACLACAGPPEFPVHILQHDERQLQVCCLIQYCWYMRPHNDHTRDMGVSVAIRILCLIQRTTQGILVLVSTSQRSNLYDSLPP